MDSTRNVAVQLTT